MFWSRNKNRNVVGDRKMIMEQLTKEDKMYYITKLMLELGMPAHLRGYHYLREAVCMSMEDMELVGSVTKLLYPEIARKYKTTDQKVERAIRNIIEVSWERGNESLMEELFGYSREHGKRRPTNSEFIAAMSDKMRMDCYFSYPRQSLADWRGEKV